MVQVLDLMARKGIRMINLRVNEYFVNSSNSWNANVIENYYCFTDWK